MTPPTVPEAGPQPVEEPMRSMREYTARYYPDGTCSLRMAIGWKGVRVESDCGMQGRHITIEGEWRCCEHYDECLDKLCWADMILAVPR
jgi:hypothetical protein